MVVQGPLPGGLADTVTFLIRHRENPFDGGFKCGRSDNEVGAQMSRFGFRGFD